MKKISFIVVLLLAALCLFAAPVVFANHDEGKDLPYFTRMPNYYVSDNEDRVFDEYAFSTNEGIKKVEGKKFRVTYAMNDGVVPSSQLYIVRYYGNQVKALGGTALFDSEDVDDKAGRVATFTLIKDKKELWFEVNPYNDGEGFVLTIIEKEITS